MRDCKGGPVGEIRRPVSAGFVQNAFLQSRFQSVRGRLFLLIAALLVPAFAIVSALIWESYRGQRAAMRAELSNTARAVAGLVETEIERSLAMLQAFIAARSLREDWDAFDTTARRVLTNTKSWLVLVDMNGRQRVNTRVPRGQALPDLVLDPNYGEAMRAGRPYVSPLVFSPAANRLVVHVARPFTLSSGEVVGVSIVMEPGALNETLDVKRFAPDGVLSVLDQSGRIIVRNPHKPEFIGGFATPDMVKLSQQQFDAVVDSVTLENIPVLTAYTRTRWGWSVIIGAHKEKLFATPRRLLWIGLGSSFLVALAAFGLATWLARAVVRSVDGLAQEAERLARGEPAPAVASPLHEIHVVAQAMRRMAATRNQAEAELREARDRLHEYAQQLEKKVEERTTSLRDAVAQMEEFSYTVSHDLRGPLRAMSAYASVLLEDYGATLAPEAKEHLHRIVRASERMNRLTADLLEYSRVARADLQRERVRLEPMLRATIEHYTELHPKSADVKLVMPMEDVWAHEASVTQALTNLLINAAKFVKPGERPRITVRTERRGTRVRIWIEDQGIGIPPEHQERLFRIFERAPGAGGFAGTGVGLAIVRKIVDKSGGTCGVDSDGASGSRFWIELDAVPAAG